MKKLGLLVSCGCALGLLTSCRSITPSAGITVETHPQTKISVNSKIVGNRLSVVEYNARKINDILQGQITVENTTRNDCQFEYRFQWLDKDGMRLETVVSTWIPVSISAREKASLKATAPNDKAEDFVFMVRFVRPSARW